MKIVKHDKEREKRCGIPEVVFGENKSTEDLIEITKKFLKDSGRIIVTRIDKNKANSVIEKINKINLSINYNEKGGVLIIKKKNLKIRSVGNLGIITAGTSDIPVAEEARTIAEELGCETTVEYDVGVAGIHRLFPALNNLKKAKALIVIAGMEGALPSVVAGLVDVPVIGVPTSVGYGAGKGGKTALFTMLNSCAPVAVMNIDNGYGAAVLAYKIIANCKY